MKKDIKIEAPVTGWQLSRSLPPPYPRPPKTLLLILIYHKIRKISMGMCVLEFLRRGTVLLRTGFFAPLRMTVSGGRMTGRGSIKTRSKPRKGRRNVKRLNRQYEMMRNRMHFDADELATLDRLIKKEVEEYAIQGMERADEIIQTYQAYQQMYRRWSLSAGTLFDAQSTVLSSNHPLNVPRRIPSSTHRSKRQLLSVSLADHIL